MGKRGPKRNHEQRERDLEITARLYMQGWYQQEIADYLSNREGDPTADYTLSQVTISKDLAEIRRRWLESSLVDMDQIKAEELAKIDRLEREYWQAWEDSRQVLETRKLQSGDKGSSELLIEAEQVGDPKFLQGIQWCIDRRVKIFGLDAPKRSEQRIEERRAVVHAALDLAKVNDDELEQLETILRKALLGAGETGTGQAALDQLHEPHILEVQGRAVPQEGGGDAGQSGGRGDQATDDLRAAAAREE